jgi:chaperonin GroEL
MNQGIIKKISSGNDAKSQLINGVKTVASVVGSTMGYRGRTVLIEDSLGKNFPTKDGYNVLQQITLDNPLENLACELLKEASQKTVDFAGDGTTGTIVLADAFVRYSNELLAKGKSPIDIKHDIEESTDLIVKFLDKLSVPITDELIYSIAKTSANGDDSIAKIVSEAFIAAGENGTVTHFRSNTDETSLEKIEGTLVESGYADEGFVNVFSDRTTVFENNPLVVVSHITFQTVNQVMPFIDFAIKNGRELVIVSEMDFQVRDALLRNKLNGTLKVVVCAVPSYGQKRKDFLMDLAMICDTTMISTLSGADFTNRAAEFLGSCKKTVIGANDSIFIPLEDMDRSNVIGKIKDLKDIISKSSNNLEKKYLQERIAKLSGMVSIIKVGGITESELKERIDRVDDAVCAVRSAQEDGVVAGGGLALMEASLQLHFEIDSVSANAITAPFFKILSNANYDITIKGKYNWLQRIFRLYKPSNEIEIPNYPIGYDVKNFEKVNMFEAGIVDSTKVVKNSLINAVSVANTILMTDNVITLKRERDE